MSAVGREEEEFRRRRAEEREAAQRERLAIAVAAIRGTDMAERMRQQEMLRAQAALLYKTGDRAKAARIMERLAPEDK